MLIPVSQFLPPATSPLASIPLFCTLVSLFMFCKSDHLCTCLIMRVFTSQGRKKSQNTVNAWVIYGGDSIALFRDCFNHLFISYMHLMARIFRLKCLISLFQFPTSLQKSPLVFSRSTFRVYACT